jgi:hypothetical protein
MTQSSVDTTSQGAPAPEATAGPVEGQRPATVRQVGEDLKNAVSAEADKAAGRTMDAGSDVAHAVGDAVDDVADALPGVPTLEAYMHSAAEQTHVFANKLREQKAGDLLSSAVAWGQRQPMMMLAGALLLGFGLSRLVKAGGGAGEVAHGPRADNTDEGRVDVGGGLS